MPHDAKTRPIHFRVTSQDFKALQTIMDRHHLTISEMLRKLIRDAAIDSEEEESHEAN